MTATERPGADAPTPDAVPAGPGAPAPDAGPDAQTPPTVVVLHGELDASESDWVAELEAAVARPGHRVVVDMLNVSFVDSSVVRALVAAYRESRDTGWLRVVYTNHLIRRVIDICGLSELLPQYTSVESALRGHAAQRVPGAETGDPAPSGGAGGASRPHGGHNGGGGRHPSDPPPHRGAPS